MAGQVLPVGAGPLVAGVARITGRYRLPSDIVSELRHVLAENPRIVILDLHAVAGYPDALAEVLDPVAPYLAAWPGTVLAISVPDVETSADILPPALLGRVLLERTPVDGLARARRLIEPQDRRTTFLTPRLQASRDARMFTRSTLCDWRLDHTVWPASLVVNELVTHSILKAETVLDLTLSHVGGRLRIAVHDYGADQLRDAQEAETPSLLEDEPPLRRGLMIVKDLTRCWGVFPSRVQGKTVWAVMDSA